MLQRCPETPARASSPCPTSLNLTAPPCLAYLTRTQAGCCWLPHGVTTPWLQPRLEVLSPQTRQDLEGEGKFPHPLMCVEHLRDPWSPAIQMKLPPTDPWAVRLSPPLGSPPCFLAGLGGPALTVIKPGGSPVVSCSPLPQTRTVFCVL